MKCWIVSQKSGALSLDTKYKSDVRFTLVALSNAQKMASSAAQGMTPRMREVQTLMNTMQPDELAMLMQSVSPKLSPQGNMRDVALGSSISPTRLTGPDPGFGQPVELLGLQGTGTAGVDPTKHRLRHAASTMYTERQKVDVQGATAQYMDAARRNGLKQDQVASEDPWTTSCE